MPSVDIRPGDGSRVDFRKKFYLGTLNQTTLGVTEMTGDSTIIKLTAEETLRLTRILLDEDKEEALLFLKQCLKPQIDQMNRGRMMRSFETA